MDKAEGDDSGDCFGRLPDDVLSHILSFMKVEEAVRTKLVSPRWRHIYPANPRLQFFSEALGFESESFDNRPEIMASPEKFVAWVDQVLGQFRAPKLESLEILFDADKKYASSVDEWIRIACEKSANRIDLCFGLLDVINDPYTFPFHLIPAGESSHLKHLGLASCSLMPFSSLSGPLVSLRSLCFHNVVFHQNEGSFEDIASSCPNLELLSFSSCSLPKMSKLCGQLSHLKTFIIEGCSGSADLEIHRVKLSHFTYEGDTHNLSLQGLSSLLQLKVLFKDWSREKVALFLSSLADEAPHLKCFVFGIIGWKDYQFPSFISTFKCLDHLVVDISIAPDTELRNLIMFLKASPVLQKLSLRLLGHSGKRSLWAQEVTALELGVSNRNVHSHQDMYDNMYFVHRNLKELEIRRFFCFCGKKEVQLAAMLLKVCPSLEKMSMDALYQDYLDELLPVRDEVNPALYITATVCEKW